MSTNTEERKYRLPLYIALAFWVAWVLTVFLLLLDDLDRRENAVAFFVCLTIAIASTIVAQRQKGLVGKKGRL